MTKNTWSFKFRRNKPIRGKLVTAEEAERAFLAKLDDPNEDRQAVKLELVRIYRSMGKVPDAMRYAEEYLADNSDSEGEVEVYFTLGQAMEKVEDFESALRFYLLALELKPANKFYAYFLFNNIGFSLNHLNRYVEAEEYLREAIAIDESRSNGYKNLGLSLEGQGRYPEAARSFIAGVQANASDPRALRHLEELVERHPEILAEMSDLRYLMNMCRQAVVFAASGIVQKN